MALRVDDVMISQLTETVSGGLSPPAGHAGNLSMSLSSPFYFKLSSALTQAEVAMEMRTTTT